MSFNPWQPGGPAAVRWFSPASSLRLWDTATGKELASHSVDGARGFVKLARAPAEPLFVTHILDRGQVALWSMADAKILFASGLPFSGLTPGYLGIFDLAFTPDGHRVRAVSQSTGSVWEWDVADRIFVRQFPGTIRDVSCTAISPDAGRALLARRNQPFAEIDLDTGAETSRWRQAVGVVRSIAFAPDGSRVVTGGQDGTIRLWDTAGAKHLALVGVHPRPVLTVAVSPDGRHALTGGEDQIVRLWDLDGKKELTSFSGHTGSIRAIAISPDGSRAASGSEDYTVRLWRLPR
jgi:WD40 repeat protein